MKIKFEEFPGWLSEELDKLVKPTTAKGHKLIGESIRAVEEGKGFFDDLARKGDRDVAGKKDPVSYKAARLVGHSAREAHQILVKVQPPPEITWESLKAFRDQVSSVTKELREIRGKTVAQLSGFYLLDMRSFGGINDRILKHSEKLTHFLEGDGSTLQKARTLTSTLLEAENMKKEIAEKSAEAGSLARSRESLRNALSKLISDLTEIENQQSVKELLSTEKSLRGDSRRFKTQTLAHLKRPLRRLRDLSERGEVPLSSDARDALKLYINSPYRSFLSSKTGPYLGTILDTLRAATTSGKLGFKPRKATRVLAQLDQLASTDNLSRLQNDGRRLLALRRKLLEDANCKILYRSRRGIADQIEQVKIDIGDAEEKDRTLELRTKLLHSRLQELLALLGTKTRQYTGRDVQVEEPLMPAPPFAQ